MNSTTSTKNINASEICSIIKECKESGVTDFRFGDIHISFKSNQSQEIEAVDMGPKAPPKEGPRPMGPERSPREQLEHLLEVSLLADPALYEELIEIEGVHDGEEDDKRIERSLSRG